MQDLRFYFIQKTISHNKRIKSCLYVLLIEEELLIKDLILGSKEKCNEISNLSMSEFNVKE